MAFLIGRFTKRDYSTCTTTGIALAHLRVRGFAVSGGRRNAGERLDESGQASATIATKSSDIATVSFRCQCCICAVFAIDFQAEVEAALDGSSNVLTRLLRRIDACRDLCDLGAGSEDPKQS